MSDTSKRYWLSWVCTDEDYRPRTFPPNAAILGWWCTGFTADDDATLCALVEVESEEHAITAVRADWPEFDGDWRFLESVTRAYVPRDRFPLSDWMVERVGGAL